MNPVFLRVYSHIWEKQETPWLLLFDWIIFTHVKQDVLTLLVLVFVSLQFKSINLMDSLDQ